jgi:hypothetical protein
MRDDARPVEFDGVEAAVAEFDDVTTRTRAAVYRTVGGRFVTEYTKSSRYHDGKDYLWEVDRAKVSSFPNLEEAAESFRPGPITTLLLAPAVGEAARSTQR